MEFGTGHDVRPGEDITMETSAGTQNLGQATYDSDSDGLGDSVLLVQGDHEYLITDADHDGTADSVRVYDYAGHEVDPTSGQPIDPPSGDGDGDGDGDAGNGSNVVAGAVGAGGLIDPTAPDPVPGTGFGGFAASNAGMSMTGDDGTVQDLGAATVDLDRDGTADTAVVRDADGAVIGYTDRDGDGIADQMTRIGPGGEVVISVSDGAGGWEVAATGYLNGSGVLIQDS
jgi:hypothetical protein